jgi:subtilase family serine protease
MESLEIGKTWAGPRARINGYTLAVVSLFMFALPLTGSSAPRQKLSGHRVQVAGLVPTGSLPNSQRVNLAIGLPLRNAQELDALLKELYDPASPNYHCYLTPEQFTARFGPSENDYQSVIDFAKANALTVTITHPNRVVLDVEGTVADIQKTFHLTLRTYRHPREAREFYAPDAEPSVDFAVPILHISGLDNYALPHPNFRMKPADESSGATPQIGSGSGPFGSFLGSDFRNAYVPGTTLNGAGQTVGLLQFDGFYASDITNYAYRAGLPNVPQITPVRVNGGVDTPGINNFEVALDIEMVMSMAPGLSRIYVFEATNGTPWVDLLNVMVTYTNIHQFSASWGNQLPGPPDPSSEQIFQQMVAQGQSFFHASGDYDAFFDGVPFPSESPNITQVGGTVLTTTNGGAYLSEQVWNLGVQAEGHYWGSSGGISTHYQIPPYQQGISMVANQGSTTMRNVPDVALTAENAYVVGGNGKTTTLGGTSVAAPLCAGFTALINQQAAGVGLAPVGFLNPALYAIGKSAAYTLVFHDITSGNNFWPSSANLFSAVPGYDLCTGWGTPNGANLISLLTRLDPWIVEQPQSQTVNAGARATFGVMARGKATTPHANVDVLVPAVRIGTHNLSELPGANGERDRLSSGSNQGSVVPRLSEYVEASQDGEMQ